MKTTELTGSSVSKEPSHSMKVSLVSVTLPSHMKLHPELHADLVCAASALGLDSGIESQNAAG